MDLSHPKRSGSTEEHLATSEWYQQPDCGKRARQQNDTEQFWKGKEARGHAVDRSSGSIGYQSHMWRLWRRRGQMYRGSGCCHPADTIPVWQLENEPERDYPGREHLPQHSLCQGWCGRECELEVG